MSTPVRIENRSPEERKKTIGMSFLSTLARAWRPTAAINGSYRWFLKKRHTFRHRSHVQSKRLQKL
jgi:hypothetical protein